MKIEHLIGALWGVTLCMWLSIGSDRFMWLFAAWSVMAVVALLWILKALRNIRK